jgi:type IV pilus biogenesis protein CpaD/CtpE
MTRRADSSLLLRSAALAAAALALASCSSLPELQVPKEVKVQVPVPCVDAARRPQRPPLASDDDLMAMDRATRTLRAWSERQKALGYLGELEAVVEGCARIPAPVPRLGPIGP